MGHVQAVCRKCGYRFNSGIVMTGGSTGTMERNTSQCPHCGGAAEIPDGFYRDGILQALRQSDLSTDELIRLRGSIQSALTSKKPVQTNRAVDDAIAAVPGLAERWMPQTPGDRIALLTALLTAIAILLALRPTGANVTINNTTNVTKNVTVVQQDKPHEGDDRPRLR